MNYYSVPAISNSSLSMFNPEQGGSPLKFKTFILDGNKKEDDSVSMENGRLIHKYIEDKDSFVIADVTKPSDMMTEWMERAYNTFGKVRVLQLQEDPVMLIKTCILPDAIRKGAYKSTKDEEKIIKKVLDEGFNYFNYLQETDGKLVISSSQKFLLENCIRNIDSNSEAVKLLFETKFGEEIFSEKAYFWKETYGEVTLDCKALLDKLRIDHNSKTITIIDFKTTGKHISLYHEAFEFWRTYRQLAFYRKAVRVSLPELEKYTLKCVVIAIETQGINECRVFDIDADWIVKGHLEFTNLLSDISICMKENNWRIDRQTLEYK